MLVWLLLLALFLTVSGGLTVLFGTPALHEQAMVFWELAIGVPLFLWAMLGLGRSMLYMAQHRAADGWDEEREHDLIRRTRQGRRSQQLLGVSLYTACRDTEDSPATQLNTLLSGAQSLEARPTESDDVSLRHSRLSSAVNEDPEDVLLRVLTKVLADLAQTLAPVPDDRPLALLLEVESRLKEGLVRRVWQQAWRDAGIRQTAEPVEGNGLAALDLWLDQRIDDQAMLLVVAVQFAPEQPEGTAEVAVGLLLGNRLTQDILSPMAYLHRPEQERSPTGADLLYAARQALDWVPLEPQAVEQVWRVGIATQRNADLSTVLTEVPLPHKHKQGLCDLDLTLGYPGPVSPWLAIAAAAQAIQNGAGPQFTFSGGDVGAGLWGTVLMPVSPLSK
ncbi:hypothetical protein [Pseudomonas sp. C1C7]|uniref:hypothetical protein n=1 Tax=Pseudomonas sp. C1C7 TaxID=2735272 RepID=UPI002113CF41|nr:hypothetical protein [Pseudomonas sp. C1C7]